MIFPVIGLAVFILLIIYGWQKSFRAAPNENKNPVATAVKIASVEYKNAVPPAILQYFDFSNVHIYGSQVRSLSDGSTQSVVSFKTGHLKENYEVALGSFKSGGFSVFEDNFNNYSFAVSGAKNLETIQVVGFPANVFMPNEYGSITVIDVKKQ